MCPILLLLLVMALLGACSRPPDPRPATIATPPDRPLDSYLANATAVRTAMLIEVALAQVRPADLRHCLDEFAGSNSPGFRPPPHGGWLVVASAQAVDDPARELRQVAAPELSSPSDDDWHDRIVYRALLRPADVTDASVACLSCVFDYQQGRISYRHAYALDTCRRAVPPERDLATVVPLG
jgi:hypothetical protein